MSSVGATSSDARARRWIIQPARAPLRGVLRVVGDKSISHRALILGALATGESELRGLSAGADVAATRTALEAMGVSMRDDTDGALRVLGQGLGGLRANGPLRVDCGNAGTAMRLLAGLLAAQSFDSVLVGDASLSRRPMGRVTRPLRARGARIEGSIEPGARDETAPLTIRGLRDGARLFATEVALPFPSAQVKSCLLLSGLFADGPTDVREPTLSRDHTERMLSAMGAPIRTMGAACRLDPTGWDGVLAPLRIAIPGDASAGAFWAAAANVVPGSRLRVRDVGVNPTRAGFVEVLRDQGGGVAVVPRGERGGEPVGDLVVVHGDGLRRGARVGGELAARCIDEVPALVAAAAVSPGESVFEDLAELRVKESDRLAALASMLRSFGVTHAESASGLRVLGGRPRGGAMVDAAGDHRIAMAAAVLALAADGPTTIDDVSNVATSDPYFVATLRGLGVELAEVP